MAKKRYDANASPAEQLATFRHEDHEMTTAEVAAWQLERMLGASKNEAARQVAAAGDELTRKLATARNWNEMRPLLAELDVALSRNRDNQPEPEAEQPRPVEEVPGPPDPPRPSGGPFEVA